MTRYHNGLQTGIHILAQGTGYYTATEEWVASYYKATTRWIEPLYKGLHTMREKCKQWLHSDRAQLCTRIHDNRKVTIEDLLAARDNLNRDLDKLNQRKTKSLKL
jgi:hypothetical protein